MSAPLAAAVEGLSAYRPTYPASDERSSRNPVVYSHLKMQAAGRTWHVLSRIADYGLDYSQRANKLAHHVILDNQAERLPGGPANLLSMPGFMREEWDGEPQLVASKPVTREPRIPSGICQHWKEVTGDAGWAGVVAESFLRDPDRLVILLFEPGQEVLPLFAEVLSLLPAEKRWDATFSTYFTSLATGTTCTWRAMVRDSKEAHESLRFVNALRIDLTVGPLGAAQGGDLVEAARTGRRIVVNRKSPQMCDIASNSANLDVEFTQIEGASKDNRFSGLLGRRPPQKAPPKAIKSTHFSPSTDDKRKLIAAKIGDSQHKNSTLVFTLVPLAVFLAILSALGIGISIGWIGIKSPFAALPSSKSIDGRNEAQGKSTKNDVSPPKALSGPQTASDNSEAKQKRIENGNVGLEKGIAPPPIPGTNTSNDEKILGAAKNGGTESSSLSSPNDAVQKTSFVAPAFLDLSAAKDLTTLWHFDLRANEEFPSSTALPAVHFYQPKWIYFKEGHKPKNSKQQGSQRVMCSIRVAGTEEEEIASVTATHSSTQVIYKLKLKHKDDAKQIGKLGWCRLRIDSDGREGVGQSEWNFSNFPLKIEDKNRRLNKSTLRWPLPETVVVDPSFLPMMSMQRIVVMIGTTSYSLNPEAPGSASQWTFPLTDFESAFTPLVCNSPRKNPFGVAINLNVAAGDERGVIEFKLRQAEQYVEMLKGDLKHQFDSAIQAFPRTSNETDDTSNQVSEFKNKMRLVKDAMALCKEDPVDSNSIAKFENVLAAAISAGESTSSSLKDGTTKTSIDELIKSYDATKTQIGNFHKRLPAFNEVLASLDDIRIVCCHLSYELENEKGDILIPAVDVVNFDDSKPADAGLVKGDEK
jgi:hypothetical protein